MAFINDEKAALALIDLAKPEGPLKDEMTHWVFMRRLTSWSKLDIAEAVKDIYDPEKIVVTPMTVPAEPEVKTLDQQKILALKGDVHRGKEKSCPVRCAITLMMSAPIMVQCSKAGQASKLARPL